jgi:lysophospholipase L1-like esterase
VKREWIYLALGDSLTVGYGAPSGKGFADQFRDMMEITTGRKVRLINMARNGATSADILGCLQSDKDAAQLVGKANMITITAGGNDLLHAAKEFLHGRQPQFLKSALKECSRNLQVMLSTMDEYRGDSRNRRKLRIRLVGLYNPFPDVPEAVFWVERFNKMFHELENDHLKVVDIYRQFAGREEELLSDDYVHPNSEGYKVMAAEANKLGYR